MSKSVIEIIVDQVLENIEKNQKLPWQKPWKAGLPTNLKSKKTYRGVNLLGLTFKDFSSRYWATYNQVRDMGGYIREGEKASMVCYWHFPKADEEKEVEGIVEKRAPMCRYYNVWNLDQIEGIENPDGEGTNVQILSADEIIEGYRGKPGIRHTAEGKAYYQPSVDSVTMPVLSTFKSPEHYYQTLYHELIHSTGHKSRLDRFGENPSDIRFASYEYSVEELVAEFGASLLCTHVGIMNDSLVENSTAYLQGWVKELKDHKRMLLTGISRAQKAVDWILGTETEKVEEPAKEMVVAYAKEVKK
jgi:antirestriction protein ArdC